MTFSTALNWFKPHHIESDNDYRILGVKRSSSIEEIKRAYRKLMMVHHPDLGGDIQLTLSINSAYTKIRIQRGF